MKWQIGYGSEFRATAILTHDFDHLEKVIGEMRLFWGCFLSFWGSDVSSWGQGCAAWPPWTWLRLDEAANWVWVTI